MLEFCMLGTGGTLPIPDRALSSVYLRVNGRGLLIDCGEGTQVGIRRLGWGFRCMDGLLLTHYHGDHCTGLAGLLLVGGTNHTLTPTIIDGRGFTAVMVSWLAKFNPIWMILTSFLLVFLGRGAGEIATKFGLNQSFGDILTGVILFCIIGSEFFINYQIKLTRRGKEQ